LHLNSAVMAEAYITDDGFHMDEDDFEAYIFWKMQDLNISYEVVIEYLTSLKAVNDE